MPELIPSLQDNDVQPQSTSAPSGASESNGDAGIVSDGTPTEVLSPSPKNPKRGGGTHTHKPDCRCRPCGSRRRQAEAVARGDGEAYKASIALKPREISRAKQAAINADLPAFTTRAKGMRDRIAQYVEVRAQHPDLKTADIARKMGINPSTLYSYITRATQQGWLKFDDPISRLDHEIAPKVLDNLNTYLDQKDKQVTIEAAKGILFPAYKEAKGIQEEGARNYLAIKFEMPTAPQIAGQESMKQITGTVVGRPKEIIDAQIIKEV